MQTTLTAELAEKNQEIALLRKIIRNLCFFYHMTDVPENPFDDELREFFRDTHKPPTNPDERQEKKCDGIEHRDS